MDTPMQPTLLRIGEIFLKGKNRNVFFKKFVRNARQLFEDLPEVEIEPQYLQVVLWHPPQQKGRIALRLQRLFGLASFSHATRVAPDIDAITEAALAIADSFPDGETFKVETKRSDKTFPLPSPEVSRIVGGEIATRTGRPVDVRSPQNVLRVAIKAEGCFVFQHTVGGPGGLPVGTSGNVTLLLSGGIDSPVAAWSTMRRGCILQAVYFHSFPYTGDKTKAKVLRLASLLARYQQRITVHVVDFTEAQKTLRAHGYDELAVLLYRRMMMRTATRLARRNGSQALVTGENLGQVASQTLSNLGVIEDAAGLPVLRPLLCLDKVEIIEQARKIGTYETSIEPYEDTCSLFVPKNPSTRSRVVALERAEKDLDVDAMADNLAASSEAIIVTP